MVPDIQEEIARISELTERLGRGVQRRIEREVTLIANLSSRPLMRDPMLLITPEVESLGRERKAMKRSLLHFLEIHNKELIGVNSQLRALSPYAVLDRGYAVARRSDGSLLKDASDAVIGESIQLRFSRSSLTASVTETTDTPESLSLPRSGREFEE